MRYSTVKLVLCFFIAATLLSGCSSLKVVETWHKPAARPHTKIMILGIGADETKRKLFENIIVDELRHRMINAVASHTILPDLDKTDRAGVVAAVHANGCDAVLTTRVLAKGDGTVSQSLPSGDSLGYVYGAAPLTTYGDFLKATLQASLYVAKTEEVVWSATFKTFDADRPALVSRELGKFFFESLRKDGLI